MNYSSEYDDRTLKKAAKPYRISSQAMEIIRDMQELEMIEDRIKFLTELKLLDAVNKVFELKSVSKMRTKRLIRHLCADKHQPWATYCHGENITPKQLAAILKEFGVKSMDIRFKKGVFKGYRRKSVLNAWLSFNRSNATD